MKLIVLKRSLIFALASIVLAGIIIGVCVNAAASALSTGQKIIVIDAGHGGVDAGVVGVTSGVKESDINLSVARALRGYFVDAGFSVVMTRSSNGGLYGMATDGFKMRDMKKRKSVIEESGADMVISVHQNFCPIPSRRGGQVFFLDGSESGKALADSIQKCLNELDENVRDLSALVGDYYMLKCTDSPSVIVECGFLSNAEDEALLRTDEYRQKVAYAIFKGAVGYYS